MANFEPTIKQHEAFEYLTGHPEITEVLFGGGAGGGKSFVAASWIIISAIKYPGTRWFVGRETLISIKQSILITFIDILKKWGISFKINYSDFVLTLPNGSVIIFRQLTQVPGDPDFDSLGSLEITGAFIEECAQVSRKAAEVLSSRIRYRLEEYGLTPKLLMTCNPTKGWLYSEFYMPYINGTMKDHRVFIPALLQDNKYIDKSYRNTLEKLDDQNRKRLLEGSWDYDESDQDIFSWDKLNRCFTNSIPISNEATHITVDPAHLGEDKTIIVVWADYHVLDIIVLVKKTTTETSNEIKEQMKVHSIREHQVAIDVDGVGAGVKDQVSSYCISIHNGGAVFRNENYKNLKTQMYYKFAEFLDKITFARHLEKHRERIMQEIYAHKRINIDNDGKLEITKKENVKKSIGRSPDFADALAFRFFWTCKYKWEN